MSQGPRIPPQGPDEWSEDARELFAFGEGPEAREKGSAYNVVLTFAHHPKLFLAWIKFNGRLLRGSSLPPRLREIVILRIADRYSSQYEWVQHVIEGRDHGLGPDEFEAVKVGPSAPIWSDIERTALLAADQMMAQGRVDDETWAALTRNMNYKEQFEFIFVVGVYTILSWMFNTIRIEPEAHNIALAESIEAGPMARIRPQ